MATSSELIEQERGSMPTVRATRSASLIRCTAWVTLAGTVTLLIGLGWDAILHRQDPTLAEREGIFTFANPGHLLFALGLAAAVAGAVLFLVGKLGQSRSTIGRLTLGTAVLGVLGLSVVSLSLTLATGGSFLAGHVHGATANLANPHQHVTTELSATVTPEQRAAADRLAHAVKVGTARFADAAIAQAAGFRRVTAYPLQGSWGPAHFLNVTYATNGSHLDPVHPPELVYFRMPDGKMLLLGAMFLAPVGQGPRPGGALTTWHTHDNLCYDGRMFSVTNGLGFCPAGSHRVPDNEEMMHVWTFDNPDGPFAHDLNRADYLAAVRQLDPAGLPAGIR